MLEAQVDDCASPKLKPTLSEFLSLFLGFREHWQRWRGICSHDAVWKPTGKLETLLNKSSCRPDLKPRLNAVAFAIDTIAL